VLTARVKILTERTFGEPLQNVIPFSHYKSRVKHNSASKFDNLGICTSEHLPKKPVCNCQLIMCKSSVHIGILYCEQLQTAVI